MHILGKIFAFTIVVAAIVASILTSKLIMVRNSWTAKSVTLRNKYASDLPKIEALELKIDSLRNEIFRSRELWGDFWAGVSTQIQNPDDGTLLVNIGARNGIRPDLAIHGFELAADGSSMYRGSFSPLEIADGTATLKPNFRATPDDVNKWQAGNWRWRSCAAVGISGQLRSTTACHSETG